MGIIKKYHDKKWTLQFLDALYNSINLRLLELDLIFSALNSILQWNIEWRQKNTYRKLKTGCYHV
jgi:hypothetical protein